MTQALEAAGIHGHSLAPKRVAWQSQMMDWLHAEPIASERLILEPLRPAHADFMVPVLAEPSLYEFTGGHAPTLDALRSRYIAQSVGRSADGSEGWLNWIITPRATDDPAGFVQATLMQKNSTVVAELAWVVTPAWQGQGIASEATRAVVDWLRSKGVDHFVAHIHPRHHASMSVAWNQGLHPTFDEKDGEVRWET
jgi:RimJ/RimL family protein N-acetyltransferase